MSFISEERIYKQHLHNQMAYKSIQGQDLKVRPNIYFTCITGNNQAAFVDIHLLSKKSYAETSFISKE